MTNAAAEAPVRLHTLTGMRFVAAVLVFLHHGMYVNAFSSPTLKEGYADVFGNAGSVGVSFFFVLSGFILTVSRPVSDTAPRFWRRRAVKIFPNHLVSLALWLILLAGAAAAGYQAYPTLAVVVPAVFLVQSWVPAYDVLSGGNPVSWSLSCEVAFYVAFPLLVRLISRVRSRRLWWWVAGIVLAVWTVPAVAELALPTGPPVADRVPVGLWPFWLVYYLPLVRGLEFGLGMVVARIVMTGRWPRWVTPGVVLPLLVACYAVGTRLPYLFGLVAATIVPLALMVGAGAARDLANRPSVLRTRPMRWLGEVSYAFYLLHFMVIVVVTGAFGGRVGDLFGFGVLAVALVAAIGVSSLLYVCVERPIVRRWGSPRPLSAASPGPA